jgi:hypothetical protein
MYLKSTGNSIESLCPLGIGIFNRDIEILDPNGIVTIFLRREKRNVYTWG